MSDRFESVVVLGAGVMGQQIAGYCLMHGKDVRVYDVKPPERLHPQTVEHLVMASTDPDEQQRRRELLNTMTVTSDAGMAAHGVDLLIECVPEDITLKRQVLFQFSRLCPDNTVFTTNTSAYLPSQMLRVVPNPELFAAMHFFPGCTLGELMGHAGTDPSTLDRLEQFLGEVGHETVVCQHESQGAIFNAMLLPYLGAALSVAAKGLASPEEVDHVWKTVTGSKDGPFQMMDIIGLDSALRISTHVQATMGMESPELTMRSDLLQRYVDQGLLGVKSGRGFYAYDVNSSSKVASLNQPEAVWPVLADVRQTSPGCFEVDATLSGTDDAYLVDHVFKGSPLLPGAGVIELFCQAVAAATGQNVTQLSDVAFVNGLRCFRSLPEHATIHIWEESGCYRCELRHVFCNRSGQVLDQNRLCASATVFTGRAVPDACAPITPTATAWHGIEYLKGHTVVLGPSMQCLRRMTLGAENGGTGEIIAGYQGGDSGLRTPSDRHHAIALIDAAFVACNFFTQHRLGNALQLPVSIGSIRRQQMPAAGQSCTVHFECKQLDQKESEFAISVIADDRVCLSIEGYQCHVIAGDSIAVLTPE